MPVIPEYKVVILGGGPAGCATALALAQRGVTDVLMVEAGCYDRPRIGESIPPDTRNLLAQLGIWQDFLQEGHDVCFGSCSSWGTDELGYNDFLFNPFGNGWHLDRRRFDRFLAAKAEASGVSLHMETRYECCVPQENGRLLLRFRRVDRAFEVVADCVVDATGNHAFFARKMGARRMFHDRLICVYGFFEISSASQFSRLTMLEAVEYGWWYAAKLPDGRLAVAVASDPEIVKRDGLAEEESWRAKLNGTIHLADALAGCRLIPNGMKVCLAPSFLLDQAVGDRWIAVGDAASTYDPISSQGIYKSLADGVGAADALVQRLSGDKQGFADYHALLTRRFDGYLKNRNYYYGLERRWPQAPFWKNRQDV